MTSFRIERINKEFLREISQLLQGRIKNEWAKKAILTGVECSRDLSYAKVFFTTIEAADQESVKAGLESVEGLIRSILGKEMRLRTIPEFRFIIDLSEEKARAMDAVLDRLKGEGSRIQSPEEAVEEPERDNGNDA
jgi:ribosome-binding factor A